MNNQNQNYIDGLVNQVAKLKDDKSALRKALYDLLTNPTDIGVQEQAEKVLRETKGFTT